MSEDNSASTLFSAQTAAAAPTTTQPLIRIRSRFPKATPNVAISSGMARIRRLSGHFTDDATNHTEQRTPPATPANNHHHQMIMSPLVINNENSNSSQQSIPLTRLQSMNKSPGNPSPLAKLNISSSHDDHLSNPSTPVSNSMSLRQFLTANSQSTGISSVPMSPAINHTINMHPTTPGGSIYNPKFSTEQIMNIIKYKALQKLKKIESECLKEKRKKNQNKQLCIEDAANLIALDRSKIRMRDLLYYNTRSGTKKTTPDTNETILEDNPQVITEDSVVDETNIEIHEYADESIIGDRSLSNDSLDSELCPKVDASATKPATQSAPQLKFAEDGSIIINEESLIIQRVDVEPHYESTVVEESENLDNLNYNSYRKFHHTKKWTKRETAKFYKALSMIGTDFTMIQRLFAHRNRDEIKRKFKREEKLNQALIDKILSTTTKIDLSVFVSASSEDETVVDETETPEPDEQTDANAPNTDITKRVKKKKVKPKRIKKRAFIESDEEDPKIDASAHTTEKNDIPFKKPINRKKTTKKVSELTMNETINNVIDHEEVVCLIEEDNDEEDNLVLDLDSNKITSNSLVMDINYAEEDDDNIILDLDNNTFITNNKTVLNVDYQEKTKQSTSSITITRIPKS